MLIPIEAILLVTIISTFSIVVRIYIYKSISFCHLRSCGTYEINPSPISNTKYIHTILYGFFYLL